MNNTIVEQFDDVTDSTDWLSTPISGLAAVEAALRCQVCKDFYKTPMLTSCNHTFCSICIRRALSNDGKCPLCRASEQEMKLRSNWSMEEVVATFTKTRPDVLLFAKRSQEATGESAKRKLEDTESFESSSQPSKKRLRSSTRLSKSRSMEITSEMACQEIEIPDQDLTDFEPKDGLVACPICLQRMKPLQVDRHLDTSCPGEPQPQQNISSNRDSRSTSTPNGFSAPSPRKPPPKAPERLPAINYSMLKEPQLKKKLVELGISTTGNRLMLEKRHKEWTTIWNANCDSQYPRRKAELLHDLDTWERTVGAKAPTSSKSFVVGAQIKDKDFDGAAWAAKHDNSFKDLIANARRNKAFVERGTNKLDEAAPTNGIKSNSGDEPTPQADTEMLASLEDSKEPQAPVDSVTQAAGIIDLTREIASSDASDAALSDGEGGTADIGASSRTTVIS
ncbi:DNA repair protein rad18 [Hypoxylon trugodes]|uniref:DNA repair protein rad18 n=1 Tax=Hypoxylon trugodes TaxID=326681 RepID=UPI00219D8F32|nr:DNA repair protein rad18 [Hypoxylon trugodes]KAI1383682.1 DNA repair protein rad18 [Hypoxylon trugodes]